MIHTLGQNNCPANIDFENGDFTNWICKAGNVFVSNNQNTVNLTNTGPLTGRHKIIPYSDTSKDYYGNFPVLCPNGSGYSVKLGNTSTNSEAEGIFYTYSIPAGTNNFSILFNYAVVFENPEHTGLLQPRFRANVINLTDGDTINCVSFDFTSSADLPGFKISPKSLNVLYKDWTPVSLNLSGYAGKTIMVEFITSDCTLGGHFGYAYIDVNSQCNGSIVGSTICVGETSVTLVAPYGYQTYAWYTDLSYSQIFDTAQIVTINPAPNVGTVYPLIVSPFPGFGCKDTIFATIKTDNKPISFAGNDSTICRFTQFQLGTVPNPAYIYSWTPTNLVTNPVIANPKGFINTFSPQQFIVKTTSRSSGCFSSDAVTMNAVLIDTSLLVTGKTNYCSNEVYNTTMTVSNLSSEIQWLFNNNPITGATSNLYIPMAAGAYRAKFLQSGCIDTTRTVAISDHVTPTANFTVNKDTQCITNNSFTFTNLSSIPNAEPLTYLWKFDDGSISQSKDPVKSYELAGLFTIRLTSTSIYCSDSAAGIIKVFPNAVPEFDWAAACTNTTTGFSNNTAENGSSLVEYLWDFDNGLTSVLKYPPPFIYTNAGSFNVSLQATTQGCEAAPQSIMKTVTVYAPKPGIRYRDITVPSTYSSQLFARWGIGNIYNWSPSIQLSNPNIRTPYFKAINDVKYLIAITDDHKCITTDTVQLFVLTKKGWYMPNAFTPNGDGLNDIIRPYLQGNNIFTRFSIYNRAGNLVFSTNRDGGGWDGKFKGNPVESGMFVWMFEYIDENKNPVVQKGSLMLVR